MAIWCVIFTYIDDIVKGIANILPNPPEEIETGAKYKVYNIGNNKPEKLIGLYSDTGKAIWAERRRKNFYQCSREMLSDICRCKWLMHDFNFKPSTSIDEG